jgi:ATP-dependent DNA helicase RecG
MKGWHTKALELLERSLEPPKHEYNEIDWKVALSNDKKHLTEHLCAFSNHPGGGYLIFGVARNGTLDGVTSEDIESISNRLVNLGRDAVEPPLQLDHHGTSFKGADILLVRIPESANKPVHKRGQSIEEAFIRSAGTTRKASKTEIAQMLLNNQTPRWEELRATVLMTDEELLSGLTIDPILRMMDRPKPNNDEERLRFMQESGFIERQSSAGGFITNLGAATAATDLRSIPAFSLKSVRVIVYKGLNKIETRADISGRYGYALSFESLLDFVSKQLPKSEVIEQALREDVAVYPKLALREIIANAIIHQDFSISGSRPMVEVYDDRIEISNPGGLLPSKSIERIIGTQPEARNVKLNNAFRLCKICEQRGSGLVRAGMEIELFGLPPIKFEQDSNHFKVTLFAPRSFAQMSAAERLNACYQHAVLKIYSSATMTNKSLRERLKMPEKQRSMVSRLIQEALDKKLIAPADPTKVSKKYAEYIPAWAAK